MKSMLFLGNFFGKGLKLIVFLLVISPALLKAQTNRVPNHRPTIRQGNVKTTSNENLRTNNPQSVMSATCPTSPVTLQGQDTLLNTVANGQTLACGANPFYIFENATTGAPTGPCIETIYTNFHNNLEIQGSEVYIQGGVPVYSLCPTCAIPIGNPF